MSTESAKPRKIFDGRYEIVSIVGRGAASVVYHGRRATAPYADVAIKVLTDKGATIPAKERLRKEALAMLYARHRYVIRLDDFRSVGDLCYLSMEYAPHRDLQYYISQRGSEVTLSQRERFFSQTAEALGYVHRAMLVHRDIKPENILVMNEAEIRLADFGVAVLPSDEASISDLQRGVGTMEYLAPEVLDGVRCDQRSDVYSLGVTFYELLAGQHPFAHAPLAEQLDIRRDGAFSRLLEINPDVPEYLDAVIMRCLAFDADARFENGQQVFEAILLGRDKSKRKTKSRSRSASRRSGSGDGSSAELGDPLSEILAEAGDTRPQSSSQTSERAPLSKALSVGELTAADETQMSDEELLIERDSARETVLLPREEVAAVRSDAHSAKGSQFDHQKDSLRDQPTLGTPTEQITDASRETSTDLGSSDAGALRESAAEMRSERSANTSGSNPRGILFSDRAGFADRIGKEPASQPLHRSLLELARTKFEIMSERASAWIDRVQSDDQLRRRVPAFAIGAALLLGILLFNSGITSSRKDTEATERALQGGNSTMNLAIDPATIALSFPQLEPGRYEGRLEGLIPGRVVPLAFIVPADASAVITMIGMDGWSPVFGKYPGKGTGTDKLRVSSNGFLIDFTGQVNGDAIVGFFNDLSTGTQGRWEARIAR